MQRVVEPELMDDRAQAEAYAEADFEEAHRQIVEAFNDYFPAVELRGSVLDLGCGPGDITFRFAARFPNCSVVGIDGSAPMIRLANERRARESDLKDRVTFIEGFIPGAPIPDQPYSAIISNSLLHHLHQPQALWQVTLQYASPETKIFIADLFRPDSEDEAKRIVNEYAVGEAGILQRDFFNSLLAAFQPHEIEEQLLSAGLSELTVKLLSDRHLLIFGEKG